MEELKPKHAGGRPPKWTSVNEIKQIIDDFFVSRDKSGEPYTISGLALALETTRELLCDYQEKDEFSATIKAAKLRCADFAEKRLFGTTPTGSIFALKNYGWRDKSEQEISGKDGKDLPPIVISIVRPPEA